MILVADEFTSGASGALEKSLGANQSNFLVSNIVAFIFNDKCLVNNVKRPFKNYFDLNDHTICHSNKAKTSDRCDGTNKITMQG